MRYRGINQVLLLSLAAAAMLALLPICALQPAAPVLAGENSDSPLAKAYLSAMLKSTDLAPGFTWKLDRQRIDMYEANSLHYVDCSWLGQNEKRYSLGVSVDVYDEYDWATPAEFRASILDPRFKGWDRTPYDGLPGGVIQYDHMYQPSWILNFWKSPYIGGYVQIVGDDRNGQPVFSDAFLRSEAERLAKLVWSRLPDENRNASVIPPVAPTQPGTLPGQTPPGGKPPLSPVDTIPDSALPIAASATAALAAFGALGAAFAQGIRPTEAIGELIGLFQGKTGTTPAQPVATTGIDAKASAKTTLETAKAIVGQPDFSSISLSSEIDSTILNQVKLQTDIRDAPGSGIGVSITSDPTLHVPDPQRSVRWNETYKQMDAAYKSGDYAKVERLFNKANQADRDYSGYSVGEEKKNLDALEKYQEHTKYKNQEVQQWVYQNKFKPGAGRQAEPPK